MKNKIDMESKIKQSMADLKKQLIYIDRTNWFFEKDTVDFTASIPFEQEASSFLRPGIHALSKKS